MEFVKNFTPPEFQAKTFTPSISANFNSFDDKNTKTLVKKEKFTPLAVTTLTNSTSADPRGKYTHNSFIHQNIVLSLTKN